MRVANNIFGMFAILFHLLRELWRLQIVLRVYTIDSARAFSNNLCNSKLIKKSETLQLLEG
jgi:hypothetical protein